jgi:hypothetical protein
MEMRRSNARKGVGEMLGNINGKVKREHLSSLSRGKPGILYDVPKRSLLDVIHFKQH